MTSPADAHNTSPFAHRNFTLFWFARVASGLSFQMQAVAVGWQVYALTGSALQLGLVGLAQFVPMVALNLLAGHAADRYQRRRIIQACMLIEALAMGFLTLGNIEGWLSPTAIFAAVAVVGGARAFEAPTMAALMPSLVPQAILQRAAALSASAMETAVIVGPAAGGLLYALGPTVPYAASCVLFATGSVLVFLIARPPTRPAKEPVTLATVFSGFAYIWRRKIVLGAISLDLFGVLLGGATALLPIYASDILHTGPWGLGLLRAAPALGAVLTSVVLSRYPMERNAGFRMFMAVIVFGIATIVFGFSTWLPLSIAALFVLGAADVVSVVIRSSLVQIATPDTMRGRVSAVNFLFVGTSNQLGEFESGVAAHLLGTVPAVVVGGVGTIAVALLWMRLFPQLRSLDRIDDYAADPKRP
ncbi:MFS transporter [Zavarzinia sp. CC-PAN008]|uniref:MFS transporter n=1 Tax=Zavarzinia sp. CC-PAN008 TaxID=3243332 RepID=UPI003F744848